MSFVDWALAVHVLSAFAYVGGLVLFWVLVVAVRRVDTPEETLRMEPMVKVGNVAVGLGVVGTIVVGIYLAARSHRFARTPVERCAALASLCAQVMFVIQAWGDMGTQSWSAVWLASAALATAGALAVRTGAWSPAAVAATARRQLV